jgi:glycosyltransferase involved in cell wall biosynthesis
VAGTAAVAARFYTRVRDEPTSGVNRIRVLCASPYPRANAGVRLRFGQLTDELRALGVDLELSPFLDDGGYRVAFKRGRWLAKAAGVIRGFVRRVGDALRQGRYDVLIVYRESAPFGPRILEVFARRRRVPILYDFDEALFVANIHHANRAWAWLRDPQRVAVSCRSADAVTVQNEYLADYARSWSNTVRVIPTAVDTDRRRPRLTPREGPLVIGWLGSETTAAYLPLLNNVLARVGSEPNVVVRIVGGAYRNDRVRHLETRAFDLDREAEDVQSFDIGILPEPDDPWSRGKGGYKALLYMAVGLPVVASRVGVNPEIVLDGETGFCVTDDDQWVNALKLLLGDPDLRRRMGSAGRRRVEERYSINVIAPAFASALRELARQVTDA